MKNIVPHNNKNVIFKPRHKLLRVLSYLVNLKKRFNNNNNINRPKINNMSKKKGCVISGVWVIQSCW
jgi:hypothetical protein